VVKAFVIIVLQ